MFELILTYQTEVGCIFQIDYCFRCARSLHFQMLPEWDSNLESFAQFCSLEQSRLSCVEKVKMLFTLVFIYAKRKITARHRKMSPT